MFTSTDGHMCAWLKAQGTRVKNCTHLCPHIQKFILRSSMSSPCWSLPHFLSHSLPQHDAPPGQHDLLQEQSTHPAQRLHHDLLREHPEAHPAPFRALTRSERIAASPLCDNEIQSGRTLRTHSTSCKTKREISHFDIWGCTS